MDPIALFTSSEGRLAPKPFALAVLAVCLAGLLSQALLAPPVIARSGVWPFVVVHCGLIWAWTVLHIKRLRDAGVGPAFAIAVAVVYALAVAFLLLLAIVFFDPPRPGPGDAGGAAASVGAVFLLFAIIALLFSPNLGAFGAVLIVLALIAALPLLLPILFSLRTGLRPRLPDAAPSAVVQRP